MTHKALLGLEITEVSTDLIYRMRKEKFNPDSIFDFLPEFVLIDNNTIQPSEYYLQFVGFEENEENRTYYLLNVNTLDHTLDYEIGNYGVEELLNQLNVQNILNKLQISQQETVKYQAFPRVNYLVVDMIINNYYDSYGGGYECDIEYKLSGYLDKDLNLIKL